MIHPPTLVDSAEKTASELDAAGTETHRIEIPDAEDGKALAVAGECWRRLGELGLDRGGAVIGLGGGAVTNVGVPEGAGLSTARPLLAGVNPRATFRKLDARLPLYREVATAEVATDQSSVADVVDEVTNSLGTVGAT